MIPEWQCEVRAEEGYEPETKLGYTAKPHLKKKKKQPAKIAQYLPRIHETGFDPKHCIGLLRKLVYSPSTWETEADQELVVIL